MIRATYFLLGASLLSGLKLQVRPAFQCNMYPFAPQCERQLGPAKTSCGFTFREKVNAKVTVNRILALRMSDPYSDGEERSGLSLKVLAVLVIAVIGVFGTGFLTSFQGLVKDAALEAQQTKGVPGLKKEGEERRGSLTKLTRREINKKLAAVPIFFASADDGKSIFTEGNKGLLFVKQADAEKYASSLKKDLKVKATSLDDFFFSLIEQKTKLSVAEGVAASSNKEATYSLIASNENIAAAGATWQETHAGDDVPLFRVQNLAFSKNDGLELPLFLSKADAETNFDRLQENKKKVSNGDSIPSISSPATQQVAFQVTSLKDVVKLWGTGGTEGRALEIYPELEDIEKARELMK